MHLVQGPQPTVAIPSGSKSVSTDSECCSRITISQDVCLGELLPCFSGSAIEDVRLEAGNTSLIYRSHASTNPFEVVGLTLESTICLSGAFLKPVNDVLQGVFRYTGSRLKISTTLMDSNADSLQDCLKRPFTPIGISLRAELPDMGVHLFNDTLHITKVGIDITARRMSSNGGYDCAYGFFGNGTISDNTAVRWYISVHGHFYHVVIVTEFDDWKIAAGPTNVTLQNVMFTAGLHGAKILSPMLGLSSTFTFGDTTLVLSGWYSKGGGFQVGAALRDCTLETLQQLYEHVFSTKLDVETSHSVCFSDMTLEISSADGIFLSGSVTVDGHTSVAASIHFHPESGIEIRGGISEFSIYDVRVKSASLLLAISKHSFRVQLAGCVAFHGHEFAAVVCLDKSSSGPNSGTDSGFESGFDSGSDLSFDSGPDSSRGQGQGLRYAAFLSYSGAFRLSSLAPELRDTFLDVELGDFALYLSNTDSIRVGPELKKGYNFHVEKGLHLYARCTQVGALKDVMRRDTADSVVIQAWCRPGRTDAKMTGMKFGAAIKLPTSDIISFGSDIRSGPLEVDIDTSGELPAISITANLYIPRSIENPRDVLTLQMGLRADEMSAEASAQLNGRWENPFGLCRDLVITNLSAGLSLEYGLEPKAPWSFSLGGSFELNQFRGDVLIHNGGSMSKKLIFFEVRNLNVAKLVSFIASCLEIRLGNLGARGDWLMLHHMRVYLSTGVTHLGRHFPRGAELDLDMTLFGKRVYMQSQVSKQSVVFRGMIEPFTLCGVDFCGARGERDPLVVDLELTSTRKRIFISGMVMVPGHNYLAVELLANVETGTYMGDLQLVIAHCLLVKVSMTKAEGGGGFTLYALIEQNIVESIVHICNEFLGVGGGQERKKLLRAELDDAERLYSAAVEALRHKESTVQQATQDRMAVTNRLEKRKQQVLVEMSAVQQGKAAPRLQLLKNTADRLEKEEKRTRQSLDATPVVTDITKTREWQQKAAVTASLAAVKDLYRTESLYSEDWRSNHIAEAISATIEHVGNALLNIKKIEIVGSFCGVSSSVGAKIVADIAHIRANFEIHFDLGDALGFMREIWSYIQKVILDVSRVWTAIFDKGKEAVEKFVQHAADEVHKVWIDGTEVADHLLHDFLHPFG